MKLRRLIISIICCGIVGIGGVAEGQLQSERPDGRQRVCLYRGVTGATRANDQTREYRVGLAENCPLLPPNREAATLPPTARLTAETVFGNTRLCTYEQSGLSWQSTIPAERPCPLAAGMLPRTLR